MKVVLYEPAALSFQRQKANRGIVRTRPTPIPPAADLAAFYRRRSARHTGFAGAHS
ncbi:hypothetical protein thalar_03437 [Litoreibacter arenae DSM 19593]|uniref:Uncharacterized protein n=1 Tax=Litoreibacter arenae DSM 19593 TaxID=1123360 RepID=S9QCP7_9RHOB|nr:hypothetical protein thalar_03437 [Litoreibacter arenae DSM 19593]